MFYGPDGSTVARRPLSSREHAKTRKQLRALKGDDDDDQSQHSFARRALALKPYESFLMKRNEDFALGKLREHQQKRKRAIL